MTKRTQTILEQALQLSPRERAVLVESLATSLDDDFPLAPEWRLEIERRVANIVSGKTKGIPLGKAMKTLRQSLERHRRARGKTSPR